MHIVVRQSMSTTAWIDVGRCPIDIGVGNGQLQRQRERCVHEYFFHRRRVLIPLRYAFTGRCSASTGRGVGKISTSTNAWLMVMVDYWGLS